MLRLWKDDEMRDLKPAEHFTHPKCHPATMVLLDLVSIAVSFLDACWNCTQCPSDGNILYSQVDQRILQLNLHLCVSIFHCKFQLVFSSEPD